MANEDLYIKKSQIPGAGNGLYTAKDIKKGDLVVEYLGERITWAECNARAEEDKEGYVFFINKNLCIDAYHTKEHLARYANDALGLTRVAGLRNNCCYTIKKNRAYVEAKMNIKAGSEILVPYGKEYWDQLKTNIEIDKVRAKKKAEPKKEKIRKKK